MFLAFVVGGFFGSNAIHQMQFILLSDIKILNVGTRGKVQSPSFSGMLVYQVSS